MSGALAIYGGAPLIGLPLPTWPSPVSADFDAVERVIRSGRLNYWGGTEGVAFEREYAASLGRTHAVAVATGTLALELALRAFLVGPGDDVVVPARTFVATASAVVAVGARPIIADIDPRTGCLTADTVSSALTERTRAVIPVHLGGWPVEMGALLALAELHGLIVIEDCAQAHGGSLRGRPVGSMGHAAAFSFCQDKILPVGEGGMLLLDDDNAYARAWAYKDHGKSLAKTTVPAQGFEPFRWLVDSFGSNWRLGELYSALGRAGLEALPGWHEARTRNASQLARLLEGLPGLCIPLPDAAVEHAFYRLYGLVDERELKPGWTRDRVLQALIAEGVPVQYGTCAEIYREAAFASTGLGPEGRLPGASAAHESSIAFFVHPTLAPEHIELMAAAVEKVHEVAAS